MQAKPKSRKVAWVVLAVVVVACAVVVPQVWEKIQYRAFERVYWPDGGQSFETAAKAELAHAIIALVAKRFELTRGAATQPELTVISAKRIKS